MATEDSYPKLISLAVHELRTPLGVASGYLRMLQRDTATPLDDRQRKMVDEAEKACARLVALIGALSEIAKFDDGLLPLTSRQTDIFPLVAEVAKNALELPEREVRLDVRGPSDGATIAGDEDRLRMALGAVFHAILREKLGPCTVVAERRLARDGARTSAVVIVAEEAGVQAAYDAPAGAFDEKRGGVGLSLPFARRVIEAHGGRLWSPDLPDPRAARGAALIAFPLT